MASEKKEKNKLLLRSIVVLVLLVCCVGLGVMYLNKDKYTDMPSGNNQVDPYYDESLNDVVEIETKYCKLYFPSEYANNIVIKYSEDFGYKAEFYGSLEGKEEVHLFNICFNSDDGFLYGYIKNENDNVINISVESWELEFDESWSQNDKDTIYVLQESLNYVINNLNKNKNYVNPN